MHALRLALVSKALCRSQSMCITLRPSAGFERSPITGGRDVLGCQSQCRPLRVKPPIAPRCTPPASTATTPRLASCAKQPCWQRTPSKRCGLEQAEGLAAEAHCLALTLETRCLEGHPTERTARTAAHTKAQPYLPELSAPQGVLQIHALDRARADMLEALRRTGREIPSIKAAQTNFSLPT